jgi:hypothetical protein
MRKAYQHHRPAPDALEKIRFLRQAFSDLGDIVEGHCPDTRERALAQTYLEMAAMWAAKGVVVNDPLSGVEESPRGPPTEKGGGA